MTYSPVSDEQKARVLSEALPYIQSFHGKTFVIKYGGNAMTDPSLKASFARDVALLQLVGIRPIIVHGGGPQIDALLKQMNVATEFKNGMRVTDEKTMHAVEMVLGELNQEIVGLLNQHGCRAVGLSGQDGHFIQAKQLRVNANEHPKTAIDLGFVGDVDHIDSELIHLLNSKHFVPVVMPIGVDSEGQAYNINADLVAGKLAEALQGEKLILMTNTPGVLDKNGKLITFATAKDIEHWFADGTIHGGMMPKLDAAMRAVKSGVKSAHIIDGRVPNGLLLEVLTNEGVGTTILSDLHSHFDDDTKRYFSELDTVGVSSARCL